MVTKEGVDDKIWFFAAQLGHQQRLVFIGAATVVLIGGYAKPLLLLGTVISINGCLN